MPRRDIKPRLHAKFGVRQEPSHRDSSGAAARSDSFKLFGLAQCQGSLTRASRRSSRARSCILAPSDDRRFHSCGPEIPADSSARVQTPASALMHGSCWTCRARLAASRCVSAFAVSFRTPTCRSHRVVRVPHFGPGSGRRTRVDPRAVLGNRPRGRGGERGQATSVPQPWPLPNFRRRNMLIPCGAMPQRVSEIRQLHQGLRYRAAPIGAPNRGVSRPDSGRFALIRGASPRFGARFGALRPDSGHFLRSLRRRAGGGWGRKGGRNGPYSMGEADDEAGIGRWVDPARRRHVALLSLRRRDPVRLGGSPRM